MSTDSEDERWLDALGGKSPNSARPSAAEREATAIRRAVLRQIEARPSFEPSQARLDMLMAEANRQGLLSKERSSLGPARSALTPSSRRLAAPKPFSSVANRIGMVDVIHELREMDKRVHGQLKDLQNRVHAMVDEALRGIGSQVQKQSIDPGELKVAVSKMAKLMEEATDRLDHMLQKPMLIIEKQMDQQRYLFEEAHKQKDLLERMFRNLFEQQRHELLQFLDHQARYLRESLEMQRHFYKEVSERFGHFETTMVSRIISIEEHVHRLLALTNPPPGKIPDEKEGDL